MLETDGGCVDKRDTARQFIGGFMSKLNIRAFREHASQARARLIRCGDNIEGIDFDFTTRLAEQCWAEGKDAEVLIYIDNMLGLHVVVDNYPQLQQRGTYEDVLLQAYTGTRANWSHFSFSLIQFLFSLADRDKALASGDPLPEQEEFVLYRGVAGVGKKRRVKGLSWSTDPIIAAWYAQRFAEWLPDPAVFQITVKRESIFCRLNEKHRTENDYIVFPFPDGVKPKRLKEMPDITAYLEYRKKKRNTFPELG